MFRFLFRVLATFALAVAVIMAVLDATRSVAASGFVLTPLGSSWFAVSPGTLGLARAAIERGLAPALWDPVALAVLALPGFVVFGVLAMILYAAGRRPRARGGPLARAGRAGS